MLAHPLYATKVHTGDEAFHHRHVFDGRVDPFPPGARPAAQGARDAYLDGAAVAGIDPPAFVRRIVQANHGGQAGGGSQLVGSGVQHDLCPAISHGVRGGHTGLGPCV